jgi:hypothetical protein
MKIFAKVNTDLSRHHRMLRVPAKKRAAAIGVYVAALLYTREAELDGFCPMGAISEIAPKDVVGELVRVGLLTREERDGEHGVTVLRYAEHNETHADIRRRLEGDRVRKKGGRNPGARQGPASDRNPAGVPPDSARNPNGIQSTPGGGIPVSASGSVSDSGSQEGSGEVRPPPNATADGAFGMLVTAWAEGIRSVTGVEYRPPRGKAAAELSDVLRVRCAGCEDPCEGARTLGAEYARANAGAVLSPFKFGDWLGSNKPVRGRGPTLQRAPIGGSFWKPGLEGR